MKHNIAALIGTVILVATLLFASRANAQVFNTNIGFMNAKHPAVAVQLP